MLWISRNPPSFKFGPIRKIECLCLPKLSKDLPQVILFLCFTRKVYSKGAVGYLCKTGMLILKLENSDIKFYTFISVG